MKAVEALDLLEAKTLKSIRRSKDYAKEIDEIYKDNHEWLEQFVVGTGLDVCCGNFPVYCGDGNTLIGVDGMFIAGTVRDGLRNEGDALVSVDSESCDFLVSNHLEGFNHTVKVLQEWWRVLKPGGRLALIVTDVESEFYNKRAGPLANPRRHNCFSATTLRRYLERCQYRDIKIERVGQYMRARCTK